MAKLRLPFRMSNSRHYVIVAILRMKTLAVRENGLPTVTITRPASNIGDDPQSHPFLTITGEEGVMMEATLGPILKDE